MELIIILVVIFQYVVVPIAGLCMITFVTAIFLAARRVEQEERIEREEDEHFQKSMSHPHYN